MLWLKREGILESVEQRLADHGMGLERELPDLFVSDDLPAALLAAKPEFAPDALHVGDRLIAQYPEVQDVSNDEMIRAIKDARTNDGDFPLTLIVLDEVQQFIGNSGDRAYSIQEVVESCSKHLGAGKKGSEVRDHFKAAPDGWPQDAVDGASVHVLALNNLGKPVDAKGLARRQITQTNSKPQTVTISPVQKIQIRKTFQTAGVGCQPRQEIDNAPEVLRTLRELTGKAGGEAPKPEIPNQQRLGDLEPRPATACSPSSTASATP